MRRLVLSIIYTCVLIYSVVTLCKLLSKDGPQTFKEARQCMIEQTQGIRTDEDLWNRFPDLVNICSIQSFLNVMGFSNTDELKFHVMPRESALGGINKCTVVSLGIGKDVEAEKAMNEAMPECDFFGADPVNDTNADIFPEVGKFFNIAVGAENGSFRSYILEDIYRYQEVKYVDIATFVKKEIRRRVIDQIMIDVEHAEYPMLPFFLKDGRLAKEGIVICQMNIEIHRPNEKQIAQFGAFFKDIIREKQWTFLSTSTLLGHVRLYMVNNGNKECRRRYFGEQEEEIDDIDM